MAKSRKFLTAGAIGVAAFALIGAGASATFTDAVHADQSITAGTLNMTVTGPSGSTVSGKTVTFAPLAHVSSTFTTGAQLVTTTNSGNIVATAINLSASDWTDNATLRTELRVSIYSWDGPNGTGNRVLVYDGLLTGLESTPIPIMGAVAAGNIDPFDVTFYAGPGATSLSNAAQGGTVVPTITVDYEG